tara:strand:- start:720 stop:1097 length:378 start_codon:yes stop_codon:yes gene_type:complete
MANITLSLNIKSNKDLNSSLQVGDTVYYCNINLLGGNILFNDGDLNKIGVVKKIYTGDFGQPLIDCNMIQGVSTPTTSDFLFFSKNNEVNMASPLGYFAKAKFVNNSIAKSEIFAASCEVFESSK